MSFKPSARQGQPSSDSSLWVSLISTAWRKAAESIIETGRLLIEARAALPHGEWLRMVQEQLPFSERAAQMLTKIAGHPILSDPKHVSYLPPSWGTLRQEAAPA